MTLLPTPHVTYTGPGPCGWRYLAYQGVGVRLLTCGHAELGSSIKPTIDHHGGNIAAQAICYTCDMVRDVTVCIDLP